MRLSNRVLCCKLCVRTKLSTLKQKKGNTASSSSFSGGWLESGSCWDSFVAVPGFSPSSLVDGFSAIHFSFVFVEHSDEAEGIIAEISYTHKYLFKV